MDELFDSRDAIGIASAIRKGEVGRREVVEHALRRIEERNPWMNAIVDVRAEAALGDADSAIGPLAGVPFVVKDLGADVGGLRRTSGSRLRAAEIAPRDATIVERYRAAGLVVIATTTASEFGRSPSTETMLHGPTRNPHDLDRSAGGSSGGTAAAVAGGIVPAGHGNDGGGSIRIPAAMCGLVGLKPSRGRTPAHPRRQAFGYPVGINHALTRTVRDSALLLDVVSGAVPGDSTFAAPTTSTFSEALTQPLAPLQVAVSTTRPDGSPVDAAAADAVVAAGQLLESLGHHVQDATPRYPLEPMREVMRVVMAVSVAAEVDAVLAGRNRALADDDIEPFTRALYDLGRRATGVELLAALQAVEQVGHDLAPFFIEHDVLLTPTVPVPTPSIGLLDPTDVDAMFANAGQFGAMTGFCNVSGQPAISLPLGVWPDGLPLGVQLVAATGREGLLLRVAAEFERVEPWPTRPVHPGEARRP